MSVSDNYGARWVKAILNWTRLKTNEGYQKEMLIRDALLECGLRKNKTIEIMNEFIEIRLMEEKNGLYYWGDTAPVNIEMKPYIDIKEKLKEETPKKDKKEELKKTQRDIYNFYRENCIRAKEEPLSYDNWLDKNKGEI